jgi:hypothetical protein
VTVSTVHTAEQYVYLSVRIHSEVRADCIAFPGHCHLYRHKVQSRARGDAPPCPTCSTAQIKYGSEAPRLLPYQPAVTRLSCVSYLRTYFLKPKKQLSCMTVYF